MSSEKEKMLSGLAYDPADLELVRERETCRRLCRKLVFTEGEHQRRGILSEIFGAHTNVQIEPPFFCDYGSNIELGENVFFNFNCVVLDVMKVRIGDNTLFGPAVQIYTAVHPLNAEERRTGLESGKAVSIGSDVWIGGGTILCPGISIGDRTVIGAGSVVTRDIPCDVVAVGNPARVIRNLDS